MVTPIFSIARMVANGGGAAASMRETRCENGRFSSSEAFRRVFATMGAQQKCVTFHSEMAEYTFFAFIFLTQTLVHATTANVQGKHQPLQWNIGKVQRNTGKLPMFHAMAFPMALTYAPLCVYTTPFGFPVVQEV